MNKKNIRPKSEGLIKHISQPLNVKHGLHISKASVEETSVRIGHQAASPPAPCPGNKDDVDQITFQEHVISRVLREEIIPALRFEISDIVEEKIKNVHNEHVTTTEHYHCKSCTCDELTQPQIPAQKLEDSPKPCASIFLEQSHILNDARKENISTVTGIELTGEKREQFKKKCFSNPIYNHKGQILLIHTEHGTKLVKYGSTEPNLKDDALNCQGKPLTESDERECLANALQCHIHELVDSIVFKDSELPDALLVDNCLTEDECANVRKISDRKDQIRVLLCLIKGRDFHILKKFVNHVRSHNEQVANSIEIKFEQNKREGKRCTKCALCQLTSHVNLKYIVDDLWKSGLINDGLFSMIVQTDKPAGAQTDLWNEVIDSFNTFSVQSPADVSHTLINALTKKQHYSQIAKGVRWMICTHKKLVCGCKLRDKYIPERLFSSIVSSFSPQSSETDILIGLNDDACSSIHSTESDNPQNEIKKDGQVC
ncbi:uncharacterized protein LOC132748348 [Ruditapes philippinarum]|uniref:uncharacterized protein LOC132748348 n=1 Tax=Ruditapes philippinarum TaxID=129788 RepID=UPI00295BE0FD|nr:uncharacterized protein LOC132748348 [Ruditapes philippinarum]